MASRPLIKESLFIILNLCGTNPYKQTKSSTLRLILTLTVFAPVLLNVLLECMLNWGGPDSVEAFTIVVAMWSLLTKMFTLLTNRKKLRNVVVKMESFWTVSNIGKIVEEEIGTIYATVKKTVKLSLAFITCILAFYIVFPLLESNRQLPYRSYVPKDLDQSPHYELIFILESFSACFSVVCLFGCDGLFIALIINIICELKIIKQCFKNGKLNSQIRWVQNERLPRIIDHHNLVLSCIKDIRGIYSILLLWVYFLNMTCICVGLLGIIALGFPPSLSYLSRYGGFTIFFIMQLFFYCVAGNYLIVGSESVSYAVYDSDWWIKTQPEYRRACAMVIQRCNKKEELTAGGMFSLNLDSFRKIIKGALSFFTLLEAVYVDN